MTQAEKIQDITRTLKEIRSAMDLLHDLECYVNTVAFLENACVYNFKDTFVEVAEIRQKARRARNDAASICNAFDFPGWSDRVVSSAALLDD